MTPLKRQSCSDRKHISDFPELQKQECGCFGVMELFSVLIVVMFIQIYTEFKFIELCTEKS